MKHLITATLLDDETLTLEQICQIIQIDKNTLIEIVKYELIQPQGVHPEDYLFDSQNITRLKKILRLHQDLEINYAGISLALELLDRIDTLEKELKIHNRP